MTSPGVPAFRDRVLPADAPTVRELARSTGFFSLEELNTVEELVRERLGQGEASGYHFLLAEDEKGMAGFVCHGPSDHLPGAFNLYWIAVAPRTQGRGLGRKLLGQAEEDIRIAGGKRILAETSGRKQYAHTRRFYLHCGYFLLCGLPNHYAPGDDLLVYEKLLGSIRRDRTNHRKKNIQPSSQVRGPC
jgi:GNAT superfamily N-acetyltransferase